MISTTYGRRYRKPYGLAPRRIAAELPTLWYDFISGDNLTQSDLIGGYPISFARSGTAYRWTSASPSLLESVASGTARFDHDPSDGSRRGLLMEESRINRCLRSRNFGHASWASGGTPTRSQNVTGIDGTANKAWTIGDDDASNYEQILQTWTIDNDSNTHVISIFILKDSDETRFPMFDFLLYNGAAVERRVYVNTSSGATATEGAFTDGSHSLRDEGNWWRLIIRLTNNTSGNTNARFRIYPARGTSLGSASVAATGTIGLDWGQLEFDVGSGDASSPIAETEGATVTRAAETATVDLSSLTLNPFSMYAAYECGTTEDGIIVEIGDDTANERVYLSSRPATGNTGLDVIDGGVSQVAITANPDPAYDTAYKVSARVKLNDYALYTDAANDTDNTGTMPTTDTLFLGHSYNDDTHLNGWLREIQIVDYAWVNGQLSYIANL